MFRSLLKRNFTAVSVDRDANVVEEVREVSVTPLSLSSSSDDVISFDPPPLPPGRFTTKKWSTWIRKFTRKLEDQLEAEYGNIGVFEKWQYATLHPSQLVTECQGDKRVRDMQQALEYLDAHGFPRSKHQKIFHRAFLAASYAQFYGDDLPQNLPRLLKENGWSELRSDVAIVTPRRFGKTWAVALWAVALLLTQPSHDVCIYSVAGRVSKMMLQTILRMAFILAQSPQFAGGSLVSVNKNEEIVWRTQDGYENSVNAYPAKPETLRGTGSKRKTGTVILEEASFIPPDVVMSIVAPTLTRKGVNLICITTINRHDQVMKSFTSATYDDGRPVMLSLTYQLVCTKCRAEGKASECTHMLNDIPHWSSIGQHRKLKAMMRAQKETYEREIRGLDISDNLQPAFASPAVLALRDSPWQEQMSNQHLIVITVDPCAGGARSAFAVISCTYGSPSGDTGSPLMMVVGAEEGKARTPEEQQELLVKHITALRRMREFCSARIIFCAESNLAFEASHITTFLRHRSRVANLTALYEDNGQPGLRTTNTTKKLMYLSMNELLTMHRVRIYSQMAVVGENCTAESMRTRIADQLLAYARILEPAKKPGDDPVEKFTGKMTGPDDLAICMQLNFLVYKRYLERRDYYDNEGR